MRETKQTASFVCHTFIFIDIIIMIIYIYTIWYSITCYNLLIILQISATDEDDGYDGEILFDILSVSNNGNNKFKLEQDHLNTNANVICSGTVKRGETYVIIVRVSDQAVQVDRRRYIEATDGLT